MRYAEIAQETERWVAEGLISAEQGERIRARYRETSSGERRGNVVVALSIVGAVVLGLGVILFFAANWSEIPTALRLALLVGALVGSYLAGWFLAERRGSHPRVGEALYLVGGIQFGATLFLTGQMYDVDAHEPLAFLLWAAGAASTGAVLRSRPLAALAILTFGAWLFAELASADGDEGALYIPVLGALYGPALYAFGTAARRQLEPLGFAGPMRLLGGALTAAATFVLTLRFVHDEAGDSAARIDDPVVLAAAIGLGAAVLAGSALLAGLGGRRSAPWEALTLVAVAGLALLAVTVPESGAGGAVVYPLLFNLLMAVVAVGAIVVGYANEEVWLVNLGIAFVALDLVARYLDVFWNLMPRSLVFIGFGLLLLALALVLERQRSRLVDRIRAG
jgi:uncharacterized membrane protein